MKCESIMNLSNMRVASKLWVTLLGLLVVMSLCNFWVLERSVNTLAVSRQDVQRIEHKVALAQSMRGTVLRGLEVATAQLATNEYRLQSEYEARLKERAVETQ